MQQGKAVEKPNVRWVLSDRQKMADIRRNLVAKFYKRGYSYNQIAKLVTEELSLKKNLSKGTVAQDVKKLLKEWREERIEDMDMAVQLELARIDEIIRECWDAWEKSKKDIQETSKSRTGVPDGEGVKTLGIHESLKDVTKYGDVRYLEMIHKQLIERRKLLGLYAPDKAEINGGISFASLLAEASQIAEK